MKEEIIEKLEVRKAQLGDIACEYCELLQHDKHNKIYYCYVGNIYDPTQCTCNDPRLEKKELK